MPISGLQNLTQADVGAVRNVLEGGSVVDWHRLHFRDHDEVDRFLRVNEFHPENRADMERLDELRDEAVEYLRTTFGLRVPDAIADGAPVRDLFLIASRSTRSQMYACVTLKVMHVIHHLAGRELLYRMPISDDEVFGFVERKVVSVVEEIRAMGHQIPQFEWSRKPRDSLITKLLAKRSVLAANVYDKLRFRLVVREKSDILPVLADMTHRLIPFNYVVPNESVNDILRLDELVIAPLPRDEGSTLSPNDSAVPAPVAREVTKNLRGGGNEFSGPDYSIINFITDLPIRIDEFRLRSSDPHNAEFGSIAFVLTEFQLVDEATARDNEAGENSHDRYKQRQRDRVQLRLTQGLPLLERAADAAPAGRGDGTSFAERSSSADDLDDET